MQNTTTRVMSRERDKKTVRSSTIITSDTNEQGYQLPSHFGNVASKLVHPHVRQFLVHRPRLSRSFENADTPFTVIAAPAGYGKSMLVRQWLMDSGLPSAWISLDRYDNDPMGFLVLLIEALRTIDNTLVEAAHGLLCGNSLPTISTLTRTLITELSMVADPFIVVLDDYHLIEDQQVHETMATLLNAPTGAMRLVLVSRVYPSLPLARLESHGALIKVSQDDLRFSDEESYELMVASDKLAISRDDAAAINQRTEGWVAGLRLVGYMLRGQTPEFIHRFAEEFSGNVRSIESYLWEEVIDLQSPNVRAFLLDIAILDRFCAPLCVAVTGNENSTGIIHQMERDRLFVVGLDDQWDWLRFHHLFSAALLERLTTEKGQAYINERHRRAAQWFEEHGMIHEATRHAIAGENWEQATRLLAPVGLNRSSMDSLERLCSWLEDIPIAAFEQHPNLAFRYAWALTWLGRLELADQMFEIVDPSWQATMPATLVAQLHTLKAFRTFFASPSQGAAMGSDAVERLDTRQVVERGVAYCVIGFSNMYSGKLSAAEHAFDLARKRLEGDPGRWFSMTEQAGSAYVLIRRGRLNDAAALLEESIARADENDGLGNQTVRNYLSQIRIEQLDLKAADRLLRMAKGFSEQHRSPLFRPMIEESWASLAWTRNLPDAAFEAIDRAIQIAELMPSQMYKSRALAQQARYWTMSGQFLFAERWVRSCGLDPLAPLIPDLQYEYVTLVRWFIACGELSRALSLTDALIALANHEGQHGDLVELLLLRAAALIQLGEMTEAIRDLDQSLELGDQGGFLLTFANELPSIQSLLDHKLLQRHHGSYLRRIKKAAVQIAPQPLKTMHQSNVDLSGREIEVLRLVAEGLSNREIGERLYISDKTVKRHLSSIYGKLHAANRVQALTRAREARVL